MSTVVEYAPYNFGHHTMLDSMARPLSDWHAEANAPRNAGYYPGEQQLSQQQRLPSMAAMISNATQGRGLSNVRGAYLSKPDYYSDYATPSPVQQTPPQLPIASSDPHAMSRRPADVRLSPAQSSTASGRSSEEFQEMMRMRQISRDHANGQIPGLYHSRKQSRDIFPAEAPPELHGGRYPQPYPRPRDIRPAPPPHQPQSPPASQHSASPCPESKSMSISNLLSNTPSNQSASGAPMPRPVRPKPSEYKITVRQQPSAARSCGFGERDRRVIDPPPIIQLKIEDPNLSPEEVSRRLRHPHLVVHCSICDETGTKDMSSMPEDFRQQRRLMGTLVASPFVGLDENGEEGCFFCFSDLSCRTPGSFRLRFQFVVLEPAKTRPGMRAPILSEATSEVFQVFNAKDFPGMQKSTPLTKRLKEQGCLISIKKGNDKSNQSHGRDESPDDDDDDEAEPRSKIRKRQKKSA